MDVLTYSSFAADAKPKMVNGKIVWSGGPSIKQHFALPEPIMYYITKNPSTPEVYKKLIKSCKYFFEKNPILVARDLNRNDKICSNEFCCGDNNKCCVEIDISKILNKIWITNIIFITENNISIFPSLIYPKLFRWNNIVLRALSNDIMFNDFKNCASFLTDIIFFEYRIINDDRSVVSLDKILEMIPNIKSCLFYYDFHMIQDATMKNICQLKNLQNLDLFVVANIPEVVNVGDLSTFIKYHADTKIKFSFNDEISDGYKVQLDALIDTIITSEAPHCLIEYFGQKKEKFNIMHKNYLF